MTQSYQTQVNITSQNVFRRLLTSQQHGTVSAQSVCQFKSKIKGAEPPSFSKIRFGLQWSSRASVFLFIYLFIYSLTLWDPKTHSIIFLYLCLSVSVKYFFFQFNRILVIIYYVIHRTSLKDTKISKIIPTFKEFRVDEKNKL